MEGLILFCGWTSVEPLKKKKKIILSVQSLDKLLKGHLYAERQPFASSSYAIGMFTPSMYQTLARYLAACCFGFPSWPL